jgi:predicted enzyme related to lactoylglutathione lyase
VRPGAVLYETTPGSVFAISRGSVLSSSTHTQMAFTVDDIDAEVADLTSRGIVFEAYEAPRTEGGIATIGAGRAAWFKDPDGNILSLTAGQMA